MRIIICIFFLLITSCEPKMAGPVGNIFSYEKYWQLSAYSERGQDRSLDLASNVYFLAFSDNSATQYEQIDLFDKNKNKVASWNNSTDSFDVNRHRTVGTYIKKTSSRKYFKATVFVNKSTADVYELRLSNLMDNAYRIENDTLLFTYKPIEKF
jgi:hypothetical protein